MKTLPTSPAPQDVTPGVVDFGNVLTPSNGGPDQRINRPGNRWRINVSMPPMLADVGRIWLARLVRGRQEGVRMRFPLNGVQVGAPGSPVIDGANQSGRLINLRGLTPGYSIREGFFFSIETDGTHYLYQVDDGITLDGTGSGSIVINPMLRVPPNDGDVCHFVQPMIEGLIEGSDFQWDYAVAHHTAIQFAIKERK